MVSNFLRVAIAVATAGAAFVGVALSTAAATLPQYGTDKHLGVASCASGVCHGSVQPLEATNVLQNEFITWTRQDKHAGAYALLLNEQSQRIAKNLGLPNAHEAQICLDCHTDNVPAAQRGDKFQLSDGIGCEACHGGAARWVSSHTASATHAGNLEQGMFPTEDLEARAELCLSCHLGTDKKFATHRIMGAGHPRLAFELDTFGVLQPQHYRVDADYGERKGAPGSVSTWLSGLVSASQRTLDLIQGERFTGGGVFPEIALFDCHACHHPMNDQRWRPRAGLDPGAIRLNDANFILLASAAEVLAPGQHRAVQDALVGLHSAVRNSRQSVVGAAASLERAVAAVGQTFSSVNASDAQLRRVLSNLFKDGGAGRYRDYVAAEQATMGADLLLIALGQRDQHKGAIDRLYSSVQDENRFDAASFSTTLAALQRAVGM